MEKKLLKIENKTLNTGGRNNAGPDNCVQKAEKPLSLKKELLALLCLFLALVIFCGASLRVLTPKRHDYGAVWDMYLREPENTVDALFFGSSLVYCDVVPSVIYEETGVSSFIMGGPEQTIPVTYYYLKEACKTQSPKTVFVEATGMIYAESNRSVKVNLTYMPWSMNRLIPTFGEKLVPDTDDAEQDTEKEKSTRFGLLFPMYSYHDRWDELEQRDFKKAIFGYDTDPLAGYTFIDHIEPMTELGIYGFDADLKTYDRNLEYAEKMVDFCNEKGINIVFFFSPVVNHFSDEWKEKMETDLTALGANFVDFNESFDELGVDMSTDFHDMRHFNYRGAEKFSRYLAARYADFGITAGGNADTELWQQRVEHFKALCDAADSKAKSAAAEAVAGTE